MLTHSRSLGSLRGGDYVRPQSRVHVERTEPLRFASRHCGTWLDDVNRSDVLEKSLTCNNILTFTRTLSGFLSTTAPKHVKTHIAATRGRGSTPSGGVGGFAHLPQALTEYIAERLLLRDRVGPQYDPPAVTAGDTSRENVGDLASEGGSAAATATASGACGGVGKAPTQEEGVKRHRVPKDVKTVRAGACVLLVRTE